MKDADKLLERFFLVNRIGNSRISHYTKDLPDTTLGFLVDKGYVKQTKYGFEITHKGKLIVKHGGASKQYLKEEIQFYCSILAALFGLISLIIALLS